MVPSSLLFIHVGVLLCDVVLSHCPNLLLGASYCQTLKPFDEKLTWSQAMQSCKSKGGRLLGFTSASDILISACHQLLQNGNLTNQSTWIESQGYKRWSWLDGTDVEEFFWSNNASINEYGGVILSASSEYQWRVSSKHNTASWDTENKALCQFDVLCELTNRSPQIEIDGQCYRFLSKSDEFQSHDSFTDGLSYEEAKVRCLAENGHLAKVDSREKNRLLAEYILGAALLNNKWSGNYWIGAEANLTNPFKWLHPYEDIMADAIINRSTQDADKACGLINQEGFIADRCDQNYSYICLFGNQMKAKHFNPLHGKKSSDGYTDVKRNSGLFRNFYDDEKNGIKAKHPAYHALTCPEDTVITADPKTGRGILSLNSVRSTTKISLPVGSYEYQIEYMDKTCFTQVIVEDTKQKRRLDIRARYSLACDMLQTENLLSFFHTIALDRYNLIDQIICKAECRRSEVSPVQIACDSDIVTVTWPTNRMFGIYEDEIPEEILRSVGFNLLLHRRFLTLFHPSSTEILYPLPEDTQRVGLELVPLCEIGLSYNTHAKSCVRV